MLETIKRWAPRGYRDVGNVMSGNLLRQGLRGIFKLLAAGFLTPQAFGVVRAVWSLFRMSATLAELGVDYATVSLGAAALGKDDATRLARLEGVALTLKLIFGVAVMVVGNAIAPMVAQRVLGDATLEPYVRLVAMLVSGQLLWRWIVNYLSVRQRFGPLALYLATMPALMLVAAVIAIVLGRFDRTTCIVIYLGAPALTTLVWFVVLRGRVAVRPVADRGLAGELLRFGRWIYATSIASANRNHLNTLLVKSPRFSGSVAAGELSAGLYSFGADLAGEITVVSKSLLLVLMPKAATHADPAALRRFVRRSYLHMAALLVPLALLVFTARPLLLLLGRLRPSFLEYLPSLGVFAILYCGNLFSLASIPMLSALYAMREPQVETWTEVAGVVLLVVAAVVLIPTHGVMGGAFAVLLQRVFSFVGLMGLGVQRLRRYDGSQGSAA